jgi:hypothetical protein
VPEVFVASRRSPLVFFPFLLRWVALAVEDPSSLSLVVEKLLALMLAAISTALPDL